MKMRFCACLLLVFSAVSGVASATYPQVTLQIGGAVTGTIVLELYVDKAPVTVANFITYVNSGFYNGLIFHRTMPNWDQGDGLVDGGLIQGGGFNTNLVYKTPTYPQILNESSNRLSNLRGTIAMARTPYADSATSQFFINDANNFNFDYGYIAGDSNYYFNKYTYTQVGYCVFGRVLSGMNFVDAIAAQPTTTENGMPNVPVNDVIIQSATVTLEVPFCIEKLEGDIDGDCDVDTGDIFKFAIQWQNPQCQGCYSADVSGDGNVDFADFAKIAANWLKCNSIMPSCN